MDFQGIAEDLLGRTADEVEAFYVEYRRRYNIDEVSLSPALSPDAVRIEIPTVKNLRNQGWNGSGSDNIDNMFQLIANYEREQEVPAPPRPRRVQEDRTPTPAAEEDSGDEVDADDSRNVKASLKNSTQQSSITTRNKARAAVEPVA